MSEIIEYLSNNKESRDEKRVINYPSLPESERLKRKRKMETETTSPKKRRRTENEVSWNKFWKCCGNIYSWIQNRFNFRLVI